MSGPDFKSLPPPTAGFTMWCNNARIGGMKGVDLVCNAEGGMSYVLIPMGDTGAAFRLEFSTDQLAALLDELVELADLAEDQHQALGMGDFS